MFGKDNPAHPTTPVKTGGFADKILDSEKSSNIAHGIEGDLFYRTVSQSDDSVSWSLPSGVVASKLRSFSQLASPEIGRGSLLR